VPIEINALLISGFPGHFILTCLVPNVCLENVLGIGLGLLCWGILEHFIFAHPVHIELNALEISGFPGHFISACLVHI
jgi:hypothetical protein